MSDQKFGRVEGIPEGEPCFVLRAQDKVAVDAIVEYWRLCGQVGSPQSHLDAVDAQVERFLAWGREHPDAMKVPD